MYFVRHLSEFRGQPITAVNRFWTREAAGLFCKWLWDNQKIKPRVRFCPVRFY